MKIFQEILHDIRKRQNIDVYINIVLAIIVSILGLAQIVDNSIISSAVLATIALVSISLLANRRENERIQMLLQRNLRNEFNPFFWENEARKHLDFEKQLKLARSIDLLGYTQVGFLRQFNSNLMQAIKDGTKVRILLVNNSSLAGDLMRDALRDPSSIDLPLQLTLNYLLDIEKRLKESGAEIVNRLEVRLTSWIPSCNLIILDNGQNGGIMDVGINTLLLNQPPPYPERPHLIFGSKEYPTEYAYFKNQFDDLWEDKVSVKFELVK